MIVSRSFKRSTDFDGTGRRLLDPADRHTSVNRAGVELRVLGDDAERADLAALAGLDPDADHAAESDGDAPPEPDAPGLDETALDRVARQMDAFTNDHAIAECQHVVVGDREAVDVDAAADVRAIEFQVPRPQRRTAEER